jgi:predicted transcriptional regulator
MNTDLKKLRELVNLSQCKLARISGVSRFKICLFELGNGSLTPDESGRIEAAIRAEAESIRSKIDTLRQTA